MRRQRKKTLSKTDLIKHSLFESKGKRVKKQNIFFSLTDAHAVFCLLIRSLNSKESTIDE